MKRNWRNNWILYLAVILLTLTSCGQDGEHAEHADTYTCPMHPTVVSDLPGRCPVCGMDLVRKARQGEKVEITEDLSKLIKSPNEVIVASIKTIRGQYKPVLVSVQAQGLVTYDTRNIYTIPARAGGRLEKIYLKYAFQPVSKGQMIAEIYSPELVTAQRELLFLLEKDPGNKPLIEASKKKLELLGFSDGQVSDLIQRKETTTKFNVYSPYSGYLITDQQAPSISVAMPSTQESTGGGMADGMGLTTSPSTKASTSGKYNFTGTIVREGDYVTSGENLFTVVNSNALRIELGLPGDYSDAVSAGSKVELSFGNGMYQVASVDFVQPFFSEGQDFFKIRVYTRKTEGLHIGQLVSARINLQSTESLWVPKEAVLDLGLQKVLFLKEHGVLKPKQVVTGASAEGMIEIKSGLASSDEIAANAQYLVDSESFIKPVK